MNAMILVDFGMTASAAECLIIPSSRVQPIRYHKVGKTQTQIEYGDNGEVVAWGDACQNHNGVKRLFKAFFGERELLGNKQDSGGINKPMSTDDRENYTEDYLHHFCTYIVDEILSKEDTTKDHFKVKWYLTIPGSWDEPARLDFKTVASKVLSHILPVSEVFIDLTESVASCESLIDSLRLPNGTWVTTCDVGGATCDIAFAEVQTVDRMLIPTVFPINSCGSISGGVIKIDEVFVEHIERVLRSKFGVKSTKIVEELANSSEWERVRHTFDASADVTVTTNQKLTQWNHPLSKVSTDGGRITISCQTLELIFDNFIKGIITEIDKALKLVVDRNPQRKSSDIIALCGGGGTMAYLLKTLKLRYSPDIEIKCPLSIE